MEYLIYVIIGLLVVGLVWFIATKNKLNQTLENIQEADSWIDVALTKRYDVLTKLIETVKGYAKHEKETLFEVVNLRKGMTVEEKNIATSKMNKNFEKINVLVENYPDLKASENFKTLEKSILEVEEHLQAARRMYNSNVSVFNQMLVTFPISAVASMSGLTKQTFFEADEHKKNDVKIEF